VAQTPEPDNVIRPSRFAPGAGGSGPDDPTFEIRLAALEAAVAEIRRELQEIRLDLREIKGKLSNVPTTFQLVFMQSGLILAIFVAALALLRFAPPRQSIPVSGKPG